VTHGLECGPSYTKNKDPAVTLFKAKGAAQKSGGVLGGVGRNEIALQASESSKRQPAIRTSASATYNADAGEKATSAADELGEMAVTK